jgi:cytoskeleton protein RodZ
MSEVPTAESSAPEAAAATAPPEISAGTLLRQAREAAGLHVAALAVALKVPPGKLEALEHDRYDQLPDAVFVRGLASAICRTLKIDARPVLDRLPRTTAPRLVQDTDGINTPFRSPRDAVASDWREQLTRPVSIAVGVLLLAAAVVLLLPGTRQGDDDAADAKQGNKTAATTPAGPALGATTAEATPSVPPEVPSAATMVPASVSMASHMVPVASAAGTAAPSRAAPAPAVAASAPAAPTAAAAGGIVVFRATGPSWVEVRDAKGVVAVRKVLGAGEDASVSGAVPLQVVVGRVNATQVEVRGKPFDLTPFARDNVARFEVK